MGPKTNIYPIILEGVQCAFHSFIVTLYPSDLRVRCMKQFCLVGFEYACKIVPLVFAHHCRRLNITIP